MTDADAQKIEQKIQVGRVIVIAIPSFLTVLVMILVLYLTVIVSNFNEAQTASACRGKVSQEIQETFRKDISSLITLAGRETDGKEQREEQLALLNAMKIRPNYVTEVKRQCGQDLTKKGNTTTTVKVKAKNI